jgi:hypothetical protein
MESRDKTAALLHLRKTFGAYLKEGNGVINEANLDKLLVIFSKVGHTSLFIYLFVSVNACLHSR